MINHFSILYLIRGLSGSGKSTLARKLSNHIFSADDYFEKSGEYLFDSSKLKDAHKECTDKVKDFLIHHPEESAAVHNTFSTRWEMEPYFYLARKYGARVTVIDLFDSGLSNKELAERNLHRVPEEIIANMRARWEHDWGSGNPLPPWKRTP